MCEDVLCSQYNSITGTIANALCSITSQGMYSAAMYIKDEIDVKLRKLHDSGYKLIITGHSLGAGVGAILAVLYWREFRNNLHCYAFSPPGSLFTLPLVEYSKSFITTIVYGNDIVPRFEVM